jgi:hypothetical protein
MPQKFRKRRVGGEWKEGSEVEVVQQIANNPPPRLLHCLHICQYVTLLFFNDSSHNK